MRDMAAIVVVGGGLSGLVAAWRLDQHGHDVVVLEAESEPGGRMRTELHRGYRIERGAQFVSGGYSNLLQVVAALGLADRVRPMASTHNAVLRDGRLHPADADSPLRLLGSSLLSTRARLRLARVPVEAFRHRDHIRFHHPERAAAIDDEDMASYLRRIVGEEAFEYLLAPAFSSTFDCEPEDLSAVFALLAIRFAGADFDLRSIEGGLGSVTCAIAETLDVRFGTRVESLETTTDGARVRFHGPHGSDGILADAAIVAVPGTHVTSLCPKLTPAERSFLEAVRYSRSILTHFLLSEPPEAFDGYGVAFPRPEGLGLYGMACDHVKSDAAPPGAGLINAALTAEASRRLWDAPDAAVAEHALGELARTPIGRLDPIDCRVFRWGSLVPLFDRGYTRRLAAFLARSDRSPRLVFAGDYLVGPYLEGAATSGLRAAEEMMSALAVSDASIGP